MKNLILLVGLFLAHLAQGQSGSLKGRVYMMGTKTQLDSVLVEVVGSDTTLAFVTKSNLEGYYEFVDLPPSEYEIKYSRKGFESVKVFDIMVQSNKITFVDASLELKSTKRERKRKRVKKN